MGGVRLPAPRVRAVHHRRDHRRHDHRRPSLAGPRRQPGHPRAGDRGGHPLRHRRGPALPRDHRLPALLRPRSGPDRRPEDLERRTRHLGCGRRRGGRRLPGRPPQAGPLPGPAGRRRPGSGRRPGHRPARQLVQPGAVRSPDHAAVGTGDRRAVPAERYEEFATFHPTFLYELVWNLGVAGVLVWADRKCEARARQGVRALRGALHRRPVLDRGAADRHRERDRRVPAEQLHVPDRLRGRAGLADLADQEPAGSRRPWSRDPTRPTPCPSSAGDVSPAESESADVEGPRAEVDEVAESEPEKSP